MENLLPTTAAATLTLFPETKEQQKTFVENLINEVLEGNTDPLKAEAQITNIESVCKAYRADKRIKEAVLNEAERYSRKELENLFNAKFQIKEVGVKYDYSECGLKKYNDLCHEIETLNEIKKSFENIMKMHYNTWIFTDPETGECYEVEPPSRTSTTQVVTEINKQ